MRLHQITKNPPHRAKRALHVLLPATAALSLFLWAGEIRAQGYVPGFEDLPLMFELDADDVPMIFDAPGGRIVEARAAGNSSPMRVMSFYRETLAQLGWRSVGEGIFEREGERLRLSVFEPKSGEVEVRFSLAPSLSRP